MSSIECILSEIAKNCENKRKKDVAINHLTKVMETLKLEDKLRIQIWDIINFLKKIETKSNNYD
jgi:replication fork clamp-binding protein CrfC